MNEFQTQEPALEKIFFSDYALMQGLCRAAKDDPPNELKRVMEHLRQRTARGSQIAVVPEAEVTVYDLRAFSQMYPHTLLVSCDEHMTYSVYLPKKGVGQKLL